MTAADALHEARVGFDQLCNTCGAFETQERRVKECWQCPIESMRNACILDHMKQINYGGEFVLAPPEVQQEATANENRN